MFSRKFSSLFLPTIIGLISFSFTSVLYAGSVDAKSDPYNEQSTYYKKPRQPLECKEVSPAIAQFLKNYFENNECWSKPVTDGTCRNTDAFLKQNVTGVDNSNVSRIREKHDTFYRMIRTFHDHGIISQINRLEGANSEFAKKLVSPQMIKRDLKEISTKLAQQSLNTPAIQKFRESLASVDTVVKYFSDKLYDSMQFKGCEYSKRVMGRSVVVVQIAPDLVDLQMALGDLGGSRPILVLELSHTDETDKSGRAIEKVQLKEILHYIGGQSAMKDNKLVQDQLHGMY